MTLAFVSVAVSTSMASIPRRPRDYQGCWDSSATNEGEEKWQKYTDVENEIIEDAYNESKTKVEIDGDYVIDLTRQIQYQVDDRCKCQLIKRDQRDSVQSNVYLRQERFSSPIKSDNSTAAKQVKHDTDAVRHVQDNGDIFSAYAILIEDTKTYADIVEEAANGIVTEGAAIDNAREAKCLSDQLLKVKHVGANVKVRGPRSVSVLLCIGQVCVLLYSKDSFWYRLINQTLRDHQTVTYEQVKTLGPFCWLLQKYLMHVHKTDVLTVYRGVNFDDVEREQFMKEEMKFTSFISTTKDRALAEIYGNTLIVIDLEGEMFDVTYYPPVGADISTISNFPQEAEFLIWPRTWFQFVKYEYDCQKQKHIIYLKVQGGG